MENNGKGSNVSWAWIAAVLLMLAMSFGGYGWASIDKRIKSAEDKTAALEVHQAAHDAGVDAFRAEVIRRLERIESKLERNSSSFVEERPPAPSPRRFTN